MHSSPISIGKIMSAHTHLLDSGIRWGWHDTGLAAALHAHAQWFKGDYSLWNAPRTSTLHLRKSNGN